MKVRGWSARAVKEKELAEGVMSRVEGWRGEVMSQRRRPSALPLTRKRR